MKILFIGGTRFVGRQMVAEACRRGHDVTLFTRGETNPDLFADVEQIRGDRDGGLDPLKGKTWDVCVDTCGYVPRVVKQSLEMLRDAVDRYLFISTISVYEDIGAESVDESGRLATLEDLDTEEIDAKTYGPLKVRCEMEVSAVFGGRALILRPGIIVGPEDYTGRFIYWPYRFKLGGRVLCPELEQPLQFIDGRDLATFAIDRIDRGATGVFNVTGPNDNPTTLIDVLKRCHELSDPEAQLIWVTDGFLRDQKVKPFADLPLWLSAEMDPYQVFRVDCNAAVAAGLVCRPLDETIHDTLDWIAQQGEGYAPDAGLPRATERDLLRKWQDQG